MSASSESFVPKPFDVRNVDISKFEKRLNPPNALPDDVISPSRYMHTISKPEKEVSTLVDNDSNDQFVNANQFRATTPNSSRSKSQFEPNTDKENSRDVVEKPSLSNGKRVIENDVLESLDEPPGKSPKFKVDENEGSRGASSKKLTLESYFTSKNVNVINLVDSNTSAPASLFEATTKSGATLASSASSDALNKVKTSGSNRSNASKDNFSSSSVSSQQQQALMATNEQLKRDLEAMKQAKEQAEAKLLRTEDHLKATQSKVNSTESHNHKLIKALEDSYRKLAIIDFKNRREKLATETVRLGKITTERTTTGVIDQWTEGYMLKHLNTKAQELVERKEALDERKKQLLKAAKTFKKNEDPARKSPGPNNGNSDTSSTNSGGGEFNVPVGRASGGRRSNAGSSSTGNNSSNNFDELDGNNPELKFDISIDMDVIKSHQEQLKRDELALAEERRVYETDKAVHQREIKRCRSEETSRFYKDLNFPTLNRRYLMQSLLGKGGFSEVWKALDLLELREVAVKVHQLNPHWSEERKSSYIKHVTREYTIHRDMKHPRIVQLFDVFEIDINSFATVLDYCPGIDLDEKLKRNRFLPEKDAKIILAQILSGLRYLNRHQSYATGGNGNSSSSSGNSEEEGAAANPLKGFNAMQKSKKISIIHYDLKPANILFDEMGDVKITDFGLSKIIDETDDGTSMELTSQGAGTYWYLPPECFTKGEHGPARITSKVDVWSAGVIFYQMLYGARPYGEGKSQENVWSDNLIRDASPVTFPTDVKFKVSEEAKELIRECLTKDPKSRPDICQLTQNRYFMSK